MSLSSLSNAGYYVPRYQSEQSRSAGLDGGQGVNAASSSSGGNSTQVSLSDSALALATAVGGASGTYAANGGGTASSDITQEEQLLGTLADKSLAALGVISPAEQSGVQISFDSVSYKVSSSLSASLSASATQQGQQVNSQLSNTQEADFTGEGTIVTADGTSIKFQIELQLGQSQQSSAQDNSIPAIPAASNGSGVDNTGVAGLASTLQQSIDPAAQLLNLLEQAGTSSTTSGTSSATLNNGNLAGNTDASGNSIGQSGSSGGLINWDAILKQSQSMIDLLSSLAAPDQTSSSAASNTNLSTVANSVS